MACRRRSIGGRLSLGRKNRLCASGAAARLASSPRQQPMQAPEVPFVFSPEGVGTWHPRRTSQGRLSPSGLCSCGLMSCIRGRLGVKSLIFCDNRLVLSHPEVRTLGGVHTRPRGSCARPGGRSGCGEHLHVRPAEGAWSLSRCRRVVNGSL